MRFRLPVLICLAAVSGTSSAANIAWQQTLPETEQLQLAEPLDVAMTRGIREFAKRELEQARAARNAPWLEGGQAAADQARQRLKKIIGIPDEFDANALHTLLGHEGNDIPHASSPGYSVRAFSWEFLPGVTGTGWIATSHRREAPVVIIIPDADQTPEQLFGLIENTPQEQQIAKGFADAGCDVICPLLINRDCTWSGHEDTKWTNLPHREYIYRLGFELGLHPVGLEVAKVLTAIQAYHQAFGKRSTVIVGSGEGALIALCAAAIEPKSIDGVLISGYFGQQAENWNQPIYRNLFGNLEEFGDAELASLIAPRPFGVDMAGSPQVSGPPQMKGRAAVAAPGQLGPPDEAAVRQEFHRLQNYYQRAGAADACQLLNSLDSHQQLELPQNLSQLLKGLSNSGVPRADNQRPYQTLKSPTPEYLANRMKSQVGELVRYSQRLLERSDNVRSKLWNKADLSSPEVFEKSLESYAQWVHKSFIGKLSPPNAPPHPRSRKIIDEPTHVGYEVTLDVYPAPVPKNQHSPKTPPATLDDPGVIAGGILLLPKDLQPGERRPVVVCQHGLEGIPMDTITEDQSTRAWAAYKGFSTELVRRGFIVYAPQNPYRGKDDFRVIQRMSNPLGRSLFSYIIEQHRQTLRWLATLPWVDRERIGFYGLSYGGKTAVRVPPLLKPRENEPGYCLSICSGDFNEWIRKNASADDKYSYVYTPEYEIFEWDMGHVANYAELSWLMVPRPFMVERGHDDGVAPDEWVAGEYAKVRRVYDKLGIGDRTEIEFFNGPHTINGQATYRFLHRHLNWPEKRTGG